MFFKAGCFAFLEENVATIDASAIEACEVTVTTKSGLLLKLQGLDAIDFVMATKPSLMEGKRMRWIKRAWVVHNMIGHPAMQILALIGLPKLGMMVHDATVPKPAGPRNATK